MCKRRLRGWREQTRRRWELMVRGNLEHVAFYFLMKRHECTTWNARENFEDRWKLSWTIQEVISESFSKKQVFWDILLRFAKFYMIKSSWCNSAFRFSWISILFEGFLTCLLILEINKMMIDIYTSTIIINNYKTKSTDYLLI